MSTAAAGRSLRENSSQWKGGRYLDTQGYVHVMITTLPEPMRSLSILMAPKRKYILEHRAAAAAKLGRPLLQSEVVHHENGEKSQNDPVNLFVVSRKDHSIEHRALEKELFLLREKVRLLESEAAGLRLLVTAFPMAG